MTVLDALTRTCIQPRQSPAAPSSSASRSSSSASSSSSRHLPLSYRTTMTTQMTMTMSLSLSLVSCVAASQCGRKELCLWRVVSAWTGSIWTSVVARELLARRPRPGATSACVACAAPKSFYYIIHHFLDFLYFSTMHIWSIFLHHILLQGHSQQWTWD